MKIKITRTGSGDYNVTVSGGMGTRPGLKAERLEFWLLGLGVAKAEMDAIRRLAPSESMTLEVQEQGAKAS